ncbi:MAG: CsgG/HfaB family protein [Thermanaerothrix sp.]|nr:CsgG/HfaB family protein [Thermanaerothrix sp.]
MPNWGSKFSRALLALGVILTLVPAAQAKTRVAVLSFQDNSGAGAPAGAIADMMTTELFNTGLFSVVERSRLDQVAAEQRMSAQGLMDPTAAVQMGKMLGADYLITGSVTQYKYEASGGVIPLPFAGFSGVAVGSETAYVTLDVRLINAATGEIVLTAKSEGAANQTQGGLAYDSAVFGTGKAGGLLGQATYKAVTKVVDQIKAKAGSAIKVKPYNVLSEMAKVVTIDAGMNNGGVQPGQIFMVYAEGSPVLGLKGEILDVEKIPLGLIQITEVNPSYSKGNLIKGVDVRRGDKVIPYWGDVESFKIGIR